MVELHNISKYYRVTKREKSGMSAALKSFIKREYQDVHAVDHVNLSVHTGEIRALIGPNGAGKSTVLKMISGVLYPSGGDIQVMDYTPWKQREQLLAFDGYSAKIEIDVRQLALKDAMTKLYNCLPISDITIENIPIEELIRDIYCYSS